MPVPACLAHSGDQKRQLDITRGRSRTQPRDTRPVSPRAVTGLALCGKQGGEESALPQGRGNTLVSDHSGTLCWLPFFVGHIPREGRLDFLPHLGKMVPHEPDA